MDVDEAERDPSSTWEDTLAASLLHLGQHPKARALEAMSQDRGTDADVAQLVRDRLRLGGAVEGSTHVHLS
ncbi:hypothetical protein EAH83_16265 [Variovorax ginsengisoli]|uniref:Uncharacterized protein n=1 Tax=Variovorax guangxiensis TaxID=1775474 RepID=A0A502DKN0_9BURK|nr:hypothetical protein EAH83_16265 [Variovorax ginsengisoli]TPG26037.1 hypothetical protein EAH82_16750 [Variovorax guangxiensis]